MQGSVIHYVCTFSRRIFTRTERLLFCLSPGSGQTCVALDWSWSNSIQHAGCRRCFRSKISKPATRCNNKQTTERSHLVFVGHPQLSAKNRSREITRPLSQKNEHANASVPVYQCTSVPVYQCTSVPVYQCSSVPVN